ncbi:MAG: hypothetical protein AAF171_07655 [Cyanobacteria bacterium P01_A01_bin.116]
MSKGTCFISSIQWIKIWLLSGLLTGLSLFSHEMLLVSTKQEPSLISDVDLFCTVYSKVSTLQSDDFILLGASRIQTGFDLATMKEKFPKQESLMLAQAGHGTSFPVFKDIVENSNFNGTIIFDETERTLISSKNLQEESIKSCRNFSIDRWINRKISTALQKRVRFLNSPFIWAPLLLEMRIPEPFFVKTSADRQRFLDFSLGQRDFPDNAISTSGEISFSQWEDKVKRWEDPILKFRQRGGTVIFVRFPVSKKLWSSDEKLFPPEDYWLRWTGSLGLESIHFSQHPALMSFELPDGTHLDKKDRAEFTRLLLHYLDLPSDS